MDRWQAYQSAYNRLGSIGAVAREFAVDRRAVARSLARARERGEAIENIGDNAGITAALQKTGIQPEHARLGYRRIKQEDGSFDTVMWTLPRVERQAEDLAERIREIMEQVRPATVIDAPAHTEADLLTVYPIADRHQGMRAHKGETGEEYNSELAKARLVDWMGRCIASAPASKRAVILDVGDGEHINDGSNLTPRSKHPLDTDARPFDVVEASVESLSATVEMAARKHEEVEIRILPGNHNPDMYLSVMFGLWGLYRDNPRVKVQKVPGDFWVRQWGRVMLAANHGHKAKAKDLVQFMADEYAPIWGQTKYRVLFTGHLHHVRMQDIGGMTHEQLTALCPRDAHAQSSAYVSRARLQAITYDKRAGEVHRCTVAA